MVLGVFIAAIATFADVSYKSMGVTAANTDRLYAADGGVDIAIQTLRANASYCPDVSATPQSLPSETLNGRTVQLTCQTQSGTAGTSAPPGPTTWPLIITGYKGLQSGNSFKTSGSSGTNTTITFGGGPVFNAGGFSFASVSDKVAFTGDLHEYDTSSYCTNAKAAAIKPQVGGTWMCENSATYPVPDPKPTVIVPTATAHAPVTVGSCTILFPGKYTSANKPSFSGSGHYYFASGVYYFQSLGDFPMNGDIFGGQPQPPDTQDFTVINPCATDATANAQVPGSATGYGVEWVVGGNTKIDPTTSASSKIELFARQPAVPANEGTAGISIYAPPAAGTNYIASTPPDVLAFGGNPGQFVVHGLAYTPNANLKIWSMTNAGAGNAPTFGGGLVTGALEVAMNGSSTTFTFASLPSGTPATARTVVVTATAAGLVAGEAATTEKAVITLGTTSATPPTVLSWRKL